jgi:hypothetical protein
MLFIIYQRYFQSTGSQNIKHGEEFFYCGWIYKKERNEQVVCSLKKVKKKY